MRWVAVAVALLLGACGGNGEHEHAEENGATSTTTPAFVASEADTAVEVTLQDYAFVGIPESVTGPDVFFTATVKGSNTHELLVSGADGDLVGEIGPFKGSGGRELAVSLPPGTYRVECLVEEGSRTHADLGMRTTFTVT